MITLISRFNDTTGLLRESGAITTIELRNNLDCEGRLIANLAQKLGIRAKYDLLNKMIIIN